MMPREGASSSSALSSNAISGRGSLARRTRRGSCSGASKAVASSLLALLRAKTPALRSGVPPLPSFLSCPLVYPVPRGNKNKGTTSVANHSHAQCTPTIEIVVSILHCAKARRLTVNDHCIAPDPNGFSRFLENRIPFGCTEASIGRFI